MHHNSLLQIHIGGEPDGAPLVVHWCATRIALSASILLRARRPRYEPGAPFPPCEGGPAPPFQTPAELRHVITGARQERAEKTAEMVAAAFRGTARALRQLLAQAVRWERRRATRAALMRCSDRVLADVGIAREHIPLVAKGVDPAEYQLRDSALRRWWTAAHARLDAAREARRQRRRLYRELDAYNDRELEEIGLRRADIPTIVRGEPVYRQAA
jgi:uncharacterized protein YjiS (DUF1127 family)